MLHFFLSAPHPPPPNPPYIVQDCGSGSIFNFNADPAPDPALYQSDQNLWPLVSGQQTLQGSILSLQASIVIVHGPPWLHFEPLKLLNVDFNADPDPDFPT